MVIDGINMSYFQFPNNCKSHDVPIPLNHMMHSDRVNVI